ncbi:MAG: hypothetical protein H0V07_08415, partial [Propionibacteriales bacterium]|nr:hypothetical protein [Propionibacteriales bacterium]
WYAAHPADGCGLRLGSQLDGSTLFAIRATTTAYRDWIGDVGVDRRELVDGNGRTFVESTWRPFPVSVSVSWQPRSFSARTTGVAVGREQLDAAAASMRVDRSGGSESGWLALCGAVRPDGARLVVKSRRLGPGVEVLADGVLPMAAGRADGWVLQASGVPLSDEIPDWLVEAVRGRWIK